MNFWHPSYRPESSLHFSGENPAKWDMISESVNWTMKNAEFLYANSYDLVFLDLTMPEKTGYEVLATLNEKGISANTIVLTADIQPEAEKIVKELGAIGYLKKQNPLNIEYLIETLRDIGML